MFAKILFVRVNYFSWFYWMLRGLVVACGFVASSFTAAQAPDFITFESGHVRPLAISDDGTRLFACNTPDNRLEVFSITDQGLIPLFSVAVGLEPVAVALNNRGEAWVVNHLSDSVSVVDISSATPRVVRTLLVGDEPRDIVFAANGRAFITTAHRGQHRSHPSIGDVPGAGDPQLTTAGVPRADVWVFDSANLGEAVGAKPLKIVELFSDTPRALTLSPNGDKVYAAAFFSGNQSAAVAEGSVCKNEEASCSIRGRQAVPGGIAGPKTDAAGERAPITGVIVKVNPETGRYEDAAGRDWQEVLKFNLPDNDVFEIDAQSLEETWKFNHVGTTIFNMATNPVSGAIYVSNFEANNIGLFEGPGDFAGTTLQGHLSQARITVLNSKGVLPRHLNKHIDYSVTPAPADVKQHSLAMPLEIVVSSDGQWLAVAAYGSNKIGVFSTASLEDDSFDPRVESAEYIELSGGGPSGLVLDESRNQLYVITRFDNTLSVVDLATKKETSRQPLFNPEPASVVSGRKFLYDANLSSSNGEAACASCHIFGDLDHLAWNLGNPDDEVTRNPGSIRLNITEVFSGGGALGFLGRILGIDFDSFGVDHLNGTGDVRDFHPNKGPMTTQSLKGLVNHGPMHWRGDRANGFFGVDESKEPPFDSELSFNNFIVAYQGLHGREDIIDPDDMQKFTDFALQMTLPPNPVRALDNSLSRAEQRGRKYYFGCDGPGLIICGNDGRPAFGEHRSDGVPFISGLGFTCEGCHTLQPEKGFFGTDGRSSFDDFKQVTKIAQLRNVYSKVGMFGNPVSYDANIFDNGHQGDQIRGFGFLHDGGVDSIFRFMSLEVFDEAFNGRIGFEGGDPQRQDIEAFMLAFDTDLPPITGQQITLSANSHAEVDARVNLLMARARQNFTSKILGGKVKECELVASAVLNGSARSWLYQANENNFRSDRAAEAPLAATEIKQLALQPGQEVTFTCVPYGSGERIALDRDRDGVLNGDEEQEKFTSLRQFCQLNPEGKNALQNSHGRLKACLLNTL